MSLFEPTRLWAHVSRCVRVWWAHAAHRRARWLHAHARRDVRAAMGERLNVNESSLGKAVVHRRLRRRERSLRQRLERVGRRQGVRRRQRVRGVPLRTGHAVRTDAVARGSRHAQLRGEPAAEELHRVRRGRGAGDEEHAPGPSGRGIEIPRSDAATAAAAAAAAG
eukprot:scaffold20159_cov55-Phaeocystis_antarctica.AAC.6